MSKEKARFTESTDESVPPPYNRDLDPDNATSPLEFAKRQKEGEQKFYPEGGPEDPPVDFEAEDENRDSPDDAGERQKGEENGE